MPRHAAQRSRRWWRPRRPRLPRVVRGRKGWWLALGIPVLVVALLYGSWALVGRGDDIARNVSVGGRDIGGDTLATAEATVNELAAAEAGRAVRIVTPQAVYESTAAALGLSVDTATTVASVAQVVHDTPAPIEPFVWLSTFVRSRDVTPRYGVDLAVLAASVVALEGERRIEPVEPSIAADAEGTVTVVPGVNGRGLDPAQLASALQAAAPAALAANGTIEVHVEETDLLPRYTDVDAQHIADQAQVLARKQLTVTVGTKSEQLSVATVASWMRAIPGAAGVPEAPLTLGFDEAAIGASITELFPDAGQPAVDAHFTVDGGRPILHPGQDGTMCCAPGTTEKVLQTLRAGGGGVEVALQVTPPDLTTEEAQALGIVEEVGRPGEFGPTTRHACCEPRVNNIHRIADIIRGHVIMPGDTFSVNDFVGKRTAERGFVDAPVIYNGVVTNDIGGGVSQFATTMFNAAFFAGLDIPAYQSHSLVISRYPRGREATISYPAPDLKIRNSTPYGVLLWPTYDSTSITVHLYSTHHVDVTAGSTSDAKAGACTRVTTPRTRTYLDGRVEKDSYFALYQPAEGVRC